MPQYTGLLQMRGNYAAMKGNGIDVQIKSKNIRNGHLLWESSLLVSHATDRITAFSADTYPYPNDGRSVSPIVGKPVYHISSFRWAGLNVETGNPQGIDQSGEISQDYSTLSRPESFDQLVYHGAARPTLFGGLRNTVQYRDFSLSFNISFKMGYYFRRRSVVYDGMYRSYRLNADYDARWKAPGHELKTYVPSQIYPANRNRDSFYENSEVLVENGDHIRLQDIALNYRINSKSLKALGVSSLQVGAYANQIGLLWKATKTDLDPDFPTGGIRTPRTIAFSIKAGF